MPKVKLNPTFLEFRGSVKDLTYRKSYGKTFASVKADMSNVQPTPAQVAQKERFRLAAAYGKTVMANPAVRELYQQAAKERNIPIFALTVADFMNAPTIHEVDLSTYHGQVGDVIKAMVADDFGVVYVSVTIINAQSDELIENGQAVETGINSGLWLYNATAPVPVGTDVRITVAATDRPGGTEVESETKTL